MKNKLTKGILSTSKAGQPVDDALIDEALNQAALDAVRDHKKAGQPLAVWQDGKTAWVRPEDVKVRQKPAKRTVRRPRRRKTA